MGISSRFLLLKRLDFRLHRGNGLGTQVEFDPGLFVAPDKTLHEGAVRSLGELDKKRASATYQIVVQIAKRFGDDLETPWSRLSKRLSLLKNQRLLPSRAKASSDPCLCSSIVVTLGLSSETDGGFRCLVGMVYWPV